MQFNINVIIVCIAIGQMLCNAQETTTNDMLTKATELDCSQFTTDYDIVQTFPFRVYVGSMLNNRTYALMDSVQNIVTLYINKESYVPSNIFCLKNLQTLIIDETPLNYGNLDYDTGIMADGLGNLKKLTKLEIYNTRINKMTDQLSNLTALKSLTLINCGLSSLPNLSKLFALTNLTIHSNPLTSLTGLSRVSTLDLANCHFSNIPVMAVPTALQYLNMENNELSQVNNLNNYRGLYSVNFNGNKIKELLPTIGQLTVLNTLIASNNELWNFPQEVPRWNYLRTLNIANNTFASYELQVIKDNYKTRTLVKLTI